MLRQTRTPFNGVQKALAAALHAAGQTDREIADACSTSANDIIWWRKEEGLAENLSPDAKARAAEEAYTPPVEREPAVRQQRTAAPPSHARILSPAEMHEAYVAPVQAGENALEIGTNMDAKVYVDLDELLTTRLLIQGNSGSGKSHLLRRLLEECAGIVQQVIIDPEGDFASFGETFGHTVIDGAKNTPIKLARYAANARQLRGSVVLTLEGMDINRQMDAVTAFLDGLFTAAPEHWHPAIVAVDEAHLFAPSGDNGEERDARKESQRAMANLMCRGRKRGLAGIIATQRLAKLHKTVAAEASNFLLGRTFLDIDIARAADLLGMSRADSEQVRVLNRGEFLGLGPAIARRPLKVKVGPVITQGRAGTEKGLTPLPSLSSADMAAQMLDVPEDEIAPARSLRVVK